MHGGLSATVGQPERTNKSVVPERGFYFPLSTSLSLSFLPSLLFLFPPNSLLRRNSRKSGKIVIRFFDGVGFDWKDTREYYCVFLFPSLFFFFDVRLERTLYEPFWKNFSSPRGSPATIGQYERHTRALYSCISYTSLYFVPFFLSLSLLGLCELVNHPTKKKKKK